MDTFLLRTGGSSVRNIRKRLCHLSLVGEVEVGCMVSSVSGRCRGGKVATQEPDGVLNRQVLTSEAP